MILDDIVRDKRADLPVRMQQNPIAALEARPLFQEPRRGFAAALQAAPRAIIAEIKKASPSKGVIRADFDPVVIGRRYAECGAAAISVLTEERYFLGSLEYLASVRAATHLPLLRKDFLFDPYQIYEARAYGADAILLIVAMLDDQQLVTLQGQARELGLDVLVEVHDVGELQRALKAQATLVGINNRDLRTFHTSLETTERLVQDMPPTVLVVAESGIDSLADIDRLERTGVHCFLIGESLMRSADPGAKLEQLLARS